MRAALILAPLLTPVLALLAGCGGDINVTKQRVDNDSDGYTAEVDCDDAHATVNPDAAERCDGLDNDCDGETDEDAEDAATWYEDGDGDGFGDAPVQACEQPEGAVTVDGDCDDLDAARAPDGVEICDALDNDCDGETDEDAEDAAAWYEDTDGDGYGAGEPTLSCLPEEGQVEVDGDCDDAVDTIHPGAEESCSVDVDNNCDGATLYEDNDGDGVPACEECDDTDASAFPGAAEICDGVDQDCDGETDEGVTSTWHRDADGDGFGDPDSTEERCAPSSGYVDDASDCDDADDSVYPDAAERCDGVDHDCDGATDEDGSIDASPWYRDADGDTFGDPDSSAAACDLPSGYVATSTDCDDGDGGVHPGASEVCDDVDQDCDGVADDGATDASTWYADADDDGYGDADRTTSACDLPDGYTATATDCDDEDGAVYPGATERCDGANTDEDCDGLADDLDSGASGKTRWYRDVDADTYGDPGSSTTACDLPSGYVATSTDCDDDDATISPAGTEVCDAAETDEDCDGLADDLDSAASGKSTFYRDADSDTYGGTSTKSACDLPSGYVRTSTDCDDSSAAVNPAASEICDTSNTDEDCDGLADDLDSSASGKSTFYRDADADRYGLSTSTTSACDLPSGYVAVGADCDDEEPDAFPGNTEVCEDGLDQDCDGEDSTCPLEGELSLESSYDVKILGMASTSLFGYRMLSGDFDGDGVGDLITSAPNETHTTSYEGVVYGHYGPFTDGLQDAQDHDSFLFDNNSYTFDNKYGWRLANLGDINDDDQDDLLVQVTRDSTPLNYVYFGGDTGAGYPTTYYDTVGYCNAASTGGHFLSGSGAEEWFCGDSTDDSSLGKVTVRTGSSTTEYAEIVGAGSREAVGERVAGGGDVDGDGYDDLWAGATNHSTTTSFQGAVYLVLAPVRGTASFADADATILGDALSDRLGNTLMMPGDMDGDGNDDIVMGSYLIDTMGPSSGAIFLVTDPEDGHASDVAAVAIYGEVENAYLCNDNPPAAGDVDGDGNLDLIIGAGNNRDGGENEGVTYLLYGPISGPVDLAEADATWEGTSANDGLGFAVAAVPDTNGDGKDEVAISAYYGDETGFADYGAVYLWYGR